MLQEFRIENLLTAPELWAFLYDYANKVIGHKQWVSPIHAQPRKAFFIGANKDSNGDLGFLEEAVAHADIVIRWQGNPDAERNDIHIMYCLAPVSSINSIWQAVSDGFNDPLFFYYRCVYLGNPVRAPQLTLSDMKADSVLKELPLVKANMQGVNGRLILSDTYRYLVEQLVSRGMEAGKLSTLKHTEIGVESVSDETGVETKLLEPLLNKMGFKPNDYIKQWALRMGRGRAVYPDYAINCDTTKNKERADFIVEAKHSIPSKKQLEKDLGQARTYARRLRAEGAMLVSVEGIWLAASKDDFSKTTSFSWAELNITDNFNVVLDFFKSSTCHSALSMPPA